MNCLSFDVYHLITHLFCKEIWSHKAEERSKSETLMIKWNKNIYNNNKVSVYQYASTWVHHRFYCRAGVAHLLSGNLEFSWYSCNILRYCSNRCIVWFSIPSNCPTQANRKFPVQLYVKFQILFYASTWVHHRFYCRAGVAHLFSFLCCVFLLFCLSPSCILCTKFETGWEPRVFMVQL
jgi:hypothetical protein